MRAALCLVALALAALALAQCPTNNCPSGATCCVLNDGSYGCCPFANADCCSDGYHCCPSGYSCDLGSGQCVKSGVLGLVNAKHVKPLADIERAASCPAGTCPSGDTCCELSGGSYGCCPYPNADCCSDHQSCCPNGYTCDLSSGQCTKGAALNGVIVTKDLVPVKPAVAATCPAGTCPKTDTCCQLSDGSYGCCPYPNADCCTDHEHCCPNGYKCDLSTGQCLKGVSLNGVIATKNLVDVKSAPAATCPAGTCPSGDTCCQLSDGSYGCCPYPNADCCADHDHCCPNGYTCDLSTGQCNKGASLTGVIVTKDLIEVKPAVAASCPAGTCPSGDTCCQLSDGSYGCCPYPNADCCTDHEHCCPNGYKCDLSTGQCNKGASLNGVIVTKDLIEVKPAPAATCPAGTCPSGDTCCQLSDGSYGCCPYPNADCCADHDHCCPNGYTCDLSTGQCNKGNTLTLVKLKMAKVKKPEAM